MDESSFNALLNWGAEESTEFPDFDFDSFDPGFFLGLDQPIEDVPDLITDYEIAAQDAIPSLNTLVQELSSRVTALENLLQSEKRKREALESYIEELQPFLVQLGSAARN